MPHVLLVNPSERKGKKVMAKRTAAQIRATKKLVALNKARRGGKSVSRAKPKRRVARSPAKAARRRPARSSAVVATRAGRVLRYRRKNPSSRKKGGFDSFISDTLMPSAIGGGGALMLDVALAMLPLPATLKTGAMQPLVKVAGAVGLGFVASKLMNRKMAEQVAAGALTVTIYNVAKAMLVKATGGKIPGLAAYPDDVLMPMGEYVGEYVGNTDESPMIGYTDSGMQVGEYSPEVAIGGYESGVYR